MRICYIISTCDKYLNTRVSYQMQTFLKQIDKNDIYYLTSKPDLERRQFGWYAMDDPKNITWKYIHFIYNMNGDFLNYDWYIFIDDDTFVFENRLKEYLTTFDHNKCYYIGCELDHIKKDFCLYMSGGAGYAVSSALYKLFYDYVRSNGINNSFKHWCDDLCIGLWIQELAKSHTINQINNNRFNIETHKNNLQLENSITFHGLRELAQFEYYMNLVKDSTVFALITDSKYFEKAKITIKDLRIKGHWDGPIVLATIDFDLNKNFIDYYGITEVRFPQIDKTNMLEKIGSKGFSNGDQRELNKINQWEKLHIFDEYFAQWNRVVYLDAGLRIFEDVKYLLSLDYKNKILAPTDGSIGKPLLFKTQICYDNSELVTELMNEYSSHILTENHMLNCVWIYDTNILKICNKTHLIELMNKYPLCKNNEMTAMNLLFHFKYKLWKSFPIKASNEKILFDWCEINNPGTNWREYCMIKYPTTIFANDC
jgi:hypothetical protein